MVKLILREEAIEDLTDIWNYTALNWSENQADKYYEMLKTASEEIAMDLVVGKNYHEIDAYLLGYKVGKHIIFYQRVPNNEIEVVRILHQQMDLKSRLTE